MRKKKRKRYIGIGVVVILLTLFISFRISAANAKMPVTVVSVKKGNVEATISTSGKVESDEIKVYYSGMNGTIGEIPVKKGQTVKAGDALLYFEEDSLSLASKDAKASLLSSQGSYQDEMKQNNKRQQKLTEATVNLEVLEQQIADHKAFIKEQERILEDKKNAKRASLSAWGMDLKNRQAEGEDVTKEMIEYQYCQETWELSREFVDLQRTINDAKEMLSSFEEYKAEMKSQKSATEDSVLSNTSKEAKEMSSEAAEIKNQQTLDYADLVKNGLQAEYDGVVTDIKAVEGAPMTTGGELLTLSSNQKVHVTVNISKTDLAKVKEGQKADVVIAGKRYEGQVAFMNHMATMNSNNMPVVEAQIAVTNADEEIYLGVEAKVTIYAQKAEQVLLVPVEAVNADKKGDFVYIVEENVVVRKDIVTGVSSDEFIEVISGLEEKDQVMTDISIGITEGMEVTPILNEPEDTAEEADNTDTDTAKESSENAESE